MHPGPAQSRAFTLLEVMIVIGMAALVLAISIPFVQRTIRRDAIYQAVHVVEDACLNARSTAIFNNSPTELLILPQEKEFSVVPGSRAAVPIAPPPPSSSASAPDAHENGTAPAPNPSRHAPKPFHGRLGDDVTIELLDVNFAELRTEEEARVRFHPNGTSDEFTVVLKIGASAWRKVTLDIVTGLPTLEVMR